jgi:hypothetical protein
MRAPPVWLILLCLLLLAGCNPAEVSPRLRSFWEGGERIPFETIAQEEWGGGYPYMEPRLVLLTTVESVNEIADFVSTQDLPKVQQVDFSTHAVIAVFRGLQPGSKQDVVIDRILLQEASKMTVVALFRTPRDGEPSATVQTSPYHLVKIAKDNRISGQLEPELEVKTGLYEPTATP